MSTPSLFDAEVLRDIAMTSVQHNTDSNWIRASENSVQWLARSSALGFTTDDVWEHLDKLGMTGQVHDNRALGPVMLRMCKQGIIKDTKEYYPSKRRHCAPIKVWRGV